MTSGDPDLSRAEALHREGRLDDALGHLTEALARRGEEPSLLAWRAMTARALGRGEAAIADLRAALAFGPDAAMHHDLADLLRRAGDLEGAERHFREALALDPAMSEAENGLGMVAKARRDVPGAIVHYRAALSLDPANARAHNNLAIACQDQARFDEAMAHFDRALALQPDYARGHFHRALLKLLLGEWPGGFEEYQWRFHLPAFADPANAAPWWDGGPADGKTVLFRGEQGLGDVIQFIRFAPLIKKIAGARVIAEVPPRLMRLLRDVPGVDALTPKGAERPAFDLHMPMMSLPLVGGFTPHRLPRFEPYLRPEPELVEAWRDRLGRRERLRVGLAWQGNPAYRADFHRSPPLAAFAPLLEIPDVAFYSFQKGHGAEQLDDLPAPLRDRIVDLGPELDTGADAFVDTAAAMECMDLLVMSDSAVIHAAGAMGRAVWVPLPRVPDWRFLAEDTEACVWYPTMRLFRQAEVGDWSGPFERIARELRVLTGLERW